MLTGIDHVIIAVTDPDAAASMLDDALGLRATGGGRHDHHGTFNRLIWLGDSYIELMGVFDAELAADSWWGRHILRLLSSADAALAGTPLSSDAVASDVALLHAQGSPIGDPAEGERVRPDGRAVNWLAARLPEPDPDLGLAFLIEHDTTAAEWTAAERAVRAEEGHPLGGPARLVRLDMPVTSMARATQRLHRDLGLAFRPSLAGGGARDTSLGRQTLRLVPSATGGQPTIVIRGGSLERQASLLGCRWVIEPWLSS
jgi:hypothetical protein